jgi:protein-S-isoprenylcysteine O-methyltransferase Ste14
LFCLRGSRHAGAAVWLVTGAISYAALYCLSFAFETESGWIGVVLMLPAMIWSGIFAVGLTLGQEMFRKAAESSTGWIISKTIMQIVVIWTLILVVIPYFITVVEDKIGIPRMQFAFQRPISVLLFSSISAFGIWAAVVMSRAGRGTPLPLDHAQRLVASGPYSYVRNPMAVSGIAQGLAVALFLGSPLVVIYALMGSMIWQLIFRPLEEDDLLKRFGPDYERYREMVKCWLPRTRPYQMDGTADSSNSVVSPLGRM